MKRFAYALFYVLVAAGTVQAETPGFSLRPAPNLNTFPLQGEDPAFGAAFLSQSANAGVESKSTGKAVLYSLLIPGLGQQYLGSQKAANAFYLLEAGIWTTFIVLETQGYLREQDYEEHARTFAGVTSTGHSDDYYGLVSQYGSWTEYEADIKREGRAALYPDAGADVLEQYFVSNRVGDFEPWVWRNTEERQAFQQTRADSKIAYRRGIYVVGLALANRVISAIVAVKMSRDLKKHSGADQAKFDLEFGAPRYRADEGFQTGVSIVRKF